jgi:hypothetical protein
VWGEGHTDDAAPRGALLACILAVSASDNPVTETAVLDLLAGMTAASIAASSLDPTTLMLVRIPALVAMEAPPVGIPPKPSRTMQSGSVR